MNDVLRRLTIGFSAGLLAGLVDLYFGFVLNPIYSVLGQYKLLSLIAFLSLAPFVLAGLASGLFYHFAKSVGPLKGRTLFPASSATVLSLAAALFLSARYLWFFEVFNLYYGSARALGHIAVVIVLFGSAVFGLYRLFQFFKRGRSTAGGTLRRVLISLTAVTLIPPAAISFLSAVPDLLSARDDQPFICFVLIDTLRADHCSCYGYGRRTTPNIDRIAGRGTVFENCWSQAPWTKPSVATIFTGLPATGHKTNRLFDSLPGEAVTLAEVFRADGYITFADSANFQITPEFNFDQGFRFFATPRTPVVLANGPVGVGIFDKIFGWTNGRRKREPGLYAVRRTLFLLRFLNSGPKFLYMHFMEPHEPYTPSKRFREAFGPSIGPVDLRPDRVHMEVEYVKNPSATLDITDEEVQELIRRYDCEILQGDYAVGELFDGLAREGFLDNSLLIITADHGEEFMEHGFLYHARALYKESIRVPLVIVDGRRIDQTPRVLEPVGLADLAPTIYDWAGVVPPAEASAIFYGQSLLPGLSDGRLDPGRTFISEIDRDVFPSRSHDRSKAGKPVGLITAEAIISPDYKFIRDYNKKATFAFDVVKDPYERYPLTEEPPRVAELAKTLDDVIKSYEDKRLKPDTGPTDEESWRKMLDLGYVR